MKKLRTDIHVRLPEKLAEQLRRAAEESDRTLNAEIAQRLKQSFEGGYWR